MITNYDACRIVEEHRGDAVVVTAMNAGNWKFGWPAVTHREELDLPVTGAMGKASSVGLGLALAHPERKVIVLDGDGSLLMNLGALVTIANKAPTNLYHFVMDNGVYATTGGQEVPGAQTTDYEEMGRSAGYAHSYSFDNLEDFATQAEQILNESGPSLIHVRTVPNIRYPEERMGGGRNNRRTPQAIQELMQEYGLRQA